MNFVKISYWGADLTIPDFLEPLWPHDLPPEAWPTFCGAGQGWGDAIVPGLARFILIQLVFVMMLNGLVLLRICQLLWERMVDFF